jgi:hypothetical protein
MDEFMRSGYGRRYFEHQLPALIEELRKFTEVTSLFLNALETATPAMNSLAVALDSLEQTIVKMNEEGVFEDDKQQDLSLDE